eukprot:211956-Hanusia_phi.AAC.1
MSARSTRPAESKCSRSPSVIGHRGNVCRRHGARPGTVTGRAAVPLVHGDGVVRRGWMIG